MAIRSYVYRYLTDLFEYDGTLGAVGALDRCKLTLLLMLTETTRDMG